MSNLYGDVCGASAVPGAPRKPFSADLLAAAVLLAKEGKAGSGAVKLHTTPNPVLLAENRLSSVLMVHVRANIVPDNNGAAHFLVLGRSSGATTALGSALFAIPADGQDTFTLMPGEEIWGNVLGGAAANISSPIGVIQTSVFELYEQLERIAVERLRR